MAIPVPRRGLAVQHTVSDGASARRRSGPDASSGHTAVRTERSTGAGSTLGRTQHATAQIPKKFSSIVQPSHSVPPGCWGPPDSAPSPPPVPVRPPPPPTSSSHPGARGLDPAGGGHRCGRPGHGHQGHELHPGHHARGPSRSRPPTAVATVISTRDINTIVPIPAGATFVSNSVSGHGLVHRWSEHQPERHVHHDGHLLHGQQRDDVHGHAQEPDRVEQHHLGPVPVRGDDHAALCRGDDGRRPAAWRSQP